MSIALAAILYLTPVKRSNAESFLDVKVMQYAEEDGRVQVFSPAFLFQHEWSPNLGIRIDGIYNTISGASPTGAPAIPEIRTETVVRTITPSSSQPSATPTSYYHDDDDDDHEADDDDDHEGEHDYLVGFKGPVHAATGASTVATPVPAPAATPSSQGSSSTVTTTREIPTGGYTIPTAEIDDTRVGANVELYGRTGPHQLSGKVSFSSEEDYQSLGIAISDGIHIGQSGTTILLGTAFTHDQITIFFEDSEETKRSVDAIFGINQIFNGNTVLQANFVIGTVSGYQNDPYKVVQLNGSLIPEKRPDSRDKQIIFLSLTRGLPGLNAAAEASYRRYSDSFDIDGNTISVAWFQRIGNHLILRPRARWHDQTEASFYAVSFEGTPEFYSADYRVSGLRSTSVGIKLIWQPSDRFSIDVGYDRYTQTGTDTATPAELYPTANIVSAGGRLWF
jgi:hypothetical protein